MKSKVIGVALLGATLVSFPAHSKAQSSTIQATAGEAGAKADAEVERKAAEWVSSLDLKDPSKESRLREVIGMHLKTIRNWNNEHPFTTVPAGINPATGNKLSDLDRQIIANSAMPSTIHQNLMDGLRKDLTEEQVETILDKYTIGKVAFTLSGYKAIVPDLTPSEEAEIVKNLKMAREQAVDFKNMKQISAIFEIYKTKCEQYLNANGRNWKQLFKDYVRAAKARKEAQKKQ